MIEPVSCTNCKSKFKNWLSEVDKFIVLGSLRGEYLSGEHGRIKFCPFCATELVWSDNDKSQKLITSKQGSKLMICVVSAGLIEGQEYPCEEIKAIYDLKEIKCKYDLDEAEKKWVVDETKLFMVKKEVFK